jgi:ABC-2 type transport system ATP-binding protein
VRFTEVSFTYPRASRPAIDEVSFTLTPGTTGLLGTNGAGKTTLMRLALGELVPSQGYVSTDSTRGEGLMLGYCPQDARFPASFRVGEVFEYLAWLRKLPRGRRAAQVRDALAVAGLESHTRVGSLSGGMLRRMAIAQAFMGDPSVVLLDEPTTGLDPEQRVRCRELIHEVSQRAAVLLSSHIIEDVSTLAARALVLAEGRIVRRLDGDELEGLDGEGLEREFLRAVSRAPTVGG